MFGVGTDGKFFIFLRYRNDKWIDQELLPVDRYSTERFLWALPQFHSINSKVPLTFTQFPLQHTNTA